MKKTFLIAIILFLFTMCKSNTTEIEYSASQIDDINEIIKVIINEDSLNVFSEKKNSKMLCEDLVKLKVYLPNHVKTNEHQLPPPAYFLNLVSIEDLLNKKIETEVAFTSKDSSYLFEQNLFPSILKVDKKNFGNINLTTLKEENKKYDESKLYDFYEITIPIFSIDNQVAYLQLSNHCGSLCGYGKSFYLKKSNGKWKVVKKWKTWIS